MHQPLSGQNNSHVSQFIAKFFQLKEQFGTAAVSYCRENWVNDLVGEALKHSKDLLNILGKQRGEQVKSLRANIDQPVPTELSALTCEDIGLLSSIIKGLEEVASNQNNNTLPPGCLNYGGNELSNILLGILLDFSKLQRAFDSMESYLKPKRRVLSDGAAVDNSPITQRESSLSAESLGAIFELGNKLKMLFQLLEFVVGRRQPQVVTSEFVLPSR